MGYSGDGSIQPDGALALGDQETQEHAKYGGAVFSCSPPAGTTFLKNKCSQPACIKPAWLLSKPLEQLPNVNAISAEGHIADTPLLVHPLTEGRQQSGIVNRGLDRFPGDDPAISQVGQEQARTTDQAPVIRVAVVWAVASTQVAVESRQRLFVQLTHRDAVPMGPIEEVFRRSKVSAGNPPGVPCL